MLKFLHMREALIKDRFVRVKSREPTQWGNMTAMLSAMDWSNIWEDADLGPVCKYLKGAHGLQLPDEIRQLLPKCM